MGRAGHIGVHLRVHVGATLARPRCSRRLFLELSGSRTNQLAEVSPLRGSADRPARHRRDSIWLARSTPNLAYKPNLASSSEVRFCEVPACQVLVSRVIGQVGSGTSVSLVIGN